MRSRFYPRTRNALVALALLASLALSATAAWAQEECQPVISVDQPVAGATVQGNVAVTGWAADPAFAAGSSSGILDVLVYRDGEVGGGGVLVGQSTKIARPDIDGIYGLAGAQTGFSLMVNFSSMSVGSHTLYAYGLTECGWAFSSVPVMVAAAGPQVSVDAPSSGVSVASGSRVTVTGWAADPAGPGTGVDLVQVFADGQMGAGGTLLGTARYGGARPDVAASLGSAELTNSGYELPWTVTGLQPGEHTLYVYARSAASGQTSFKTVAITVTGAETGGSPSGASGSRTGGAIIDVESPATGSTARDTVMVRGVAVDCATGLAATRIKVYNGNANGTLLGEARLTNTSRTLQSLCGAGSGSAPLGWEYSLNSRNLSEGNRTLTVVAEFSGNVSATDTLNVNVDNRLSSGSGQGYGNGYYGGGGQYGYGNCQAGYSYSGGSCTYVGGEYGTCQSGYAYQNGSCIYTGTGGNCSGYGTGYNSGYYGYNNNCGGYGGNTCSNYNYPTNNNYGYNNNNCYGGYGNCPIGSIYNASNGTCTPTGGGSGTCSSGVIVLDQAFTTVPVLSSVTLSGYALTGTGVGSAQAAQSVGLRDVSTNQAAQTIPVTQSSISRTDAQNLYGVSALYSGYTASWNTSGLGLSGFSRLIEVTATTPACGSFSRIFTVTVSNTGGGVLPLVSIGNAQANEGPAAGGSALSFAVGLSQPSTTGIVTVNYQTLDGTATAGSDYTTTTGQITFQPGTTLQTITVNTIGDGTAEPAETFSVILSLPIGAVLSQTTGIGTILNDD